MGGHVRQSNTASHYDHHGNVFTAGQNCEVTDAALIRWLQSAQYLPSSHANSQALLQDYTPFGGQMPQDRLKLFRLLRSFSDLPEASPAEQSSTTPVYSGSGRHNAMGGLSSPELRGDIGGGILDLHSMDDTELLSEHIVHEPFEASPFGTYPEKESVNESEILWPSNKGDQSSPMRAASYGEANGKENTSGLARIKVVVRKRPLNKKEVGRKEEDIITVDANGCSITVHEPKLKVDLTAYVEKHDFVFDAVLDEQVSNDEVYRVTVEPIIPCIFQRTKATCFAYGQTGSGKTFTMQPLPLRACQDILGLMQHPSNRGQGLQLWFSFFEIYGGKLYDLLNDRRKLMMREDGCQQLEAWDQPVQMKSLPGRMRSFSW